MSGITLPPTKHLRGELLRAVIDQPLMLRLSTSLDSPIEPTRGYTAVRLGGWSVDPEQGKARIDSVLFQFGGPLDAPVVAMWISAGDGPPLFGLTRLPGGPYEAKRAGDELEVPGVEIAI